MVLRVQAPIAYGRAQPRPFSAPAPIGLQRSSRLTSARASAALNLGGTARLGFFTFVASSLLFAALYHPAKTRAAVEAPTTIHRWEPAPSFADRWNQQWAADAEAEDYLRPARTTRAVTTSSVASLGGARAGFALASASSTPIDLPAAKGKTASIAAAPVAVPKDEVDRYLWEVYQRAPVKKDGSGDFTWKDPAAAKRLGMSMPDYVIGGMDRDFREQLYHAGKAMDAAGVKWAMLSAFRDDYRQQLASGLKASPKNSMHGGSARVGGYGHGRAVDITGADDDADSVWKWIDAHGAEYGLHRPMPGYDPAHVQPRGEWHQIAQSLRKNRIKLAQARNTGDAQAAKSKVANASD